MRHFVVVAALSLTICACSDTGGYKAPAGTLIGAGLGGLGGSYIGHGAGRIAAITGGALLGGFLGNQAGQSLDRADYVYRQQRPPAFSQQVPQPYYYSAAPAYYAAPPMSYARGAWAPAGPCQPLVSTNPWERPAYACQSGLGYWQIVQ
jgi:predicted lipid-binding transport protein (Tim44 family)